MNKKQTIILNENQLREIVKESVKRVLKETTRKDIFDSDKQYRKILTWVRKKFPNMDPSEQLEFASNIVAKKEREAFKFTSTLPAIPDKKLAPRFEVNRFCDVYGGRYFKGIDLIDHQTQKIYGRSFQRKENKNPEAWLKSTIEKIIEHIPTNTNRYVDNIDDVLKPSIYSSTMSMFDRMVDFSNDSLD